MCPVIPPEVSGISIEPYKTPEKADADSKK